MLDTRKMIDMVKSADAAAGPTMTSRPAHEHGEVAALVVPRESTAQNRPGSPSFSLVELGLQAVAQWLRDSIE